MARVASGAVSVSGSTAQQKLYTPISNQPMPSWMSQFFENATVLARLVHRGVDQTRRSHEPRLGRPARASGARGRELLAVGPQDGLSVERLAVHADFLGIALHAIVLR